MPRFTKETVKQLAAIQEDALTFDDTQPGFFVRTYKSGAPAQFGVKYQVGGKARRMNLGAVTANAGNLDTMRDLAETTRAKAKLGQDTLGEQKAERAKTATAVTLGRLVPTYLKARAEDLRPHSLTMTTMYLTKHWLPLHGRAVAEISRRDVVAVVDEIAEARGKVAADRARSQLSALFAWSIDKGYTDANPCLNIRARASSETKTRALSEAELASVWNSCDADDFGRIMKLLILTGARKAEIADLSWDEIDFEKQWISLAPERVKNGVEFVLPLSAQALAILKTCPAVAGRARVFSSIDWWSRKNGLDARLPSGMPGFVVHDVRRSFVTLMAENGIAPPHIVEACVNHQSGHKGGIAGVYNRASYLKEKTAAFDAWGKLVQALVDGELSEAKKAA